MVNTPCDHPDWWEVTTRREEGVRHVYCTGCDANWETLLHPTRKPSVIITIDEESA